MTLRSLIILGLILILLQSCVSRNQLTYLQQEQDNKVTDSLLTVTKTPQPYRVQINDLLSIRVKAMDQELVEMFNPIDESNSDATTEEQVYFDGFKVDRKGEIRIPTVGKIKVIGLTLKEIRKKVKKELLDRYFKQEANLFVTVKLPGIRYTVTGEVNQTGSFIFYKEDVTIMEALANAGDITTVGDRQDVTIIRKYPEGKRVHHVDLTEINAVDSPYYYIQPNDLIIVNPLPQKSIGLGENAFGTITALATKCTIEVKRAGESESKEYELNNIDNENEL